MHHPVQPGAAQDPESDLPAEKIPMHPDDSAALLAWVTAKRFHEYAFGRRFAQEMAGTYPHTCDLRL